MRTIHYSANSVMPNTTGAVGVKVLDAHEAEPNVSLGPILGWALADGIEPQPLFMWHKQCDAIYDPTTAMFTRNTANAGRALRRLCQSLHTQIEKR